MAKKKTEVRSTNPNASDGIAEDLIRAFVQASCTELHTKTLLEKAMAEMENGLIDTEDKEVMDRQCELIEQLEEELNEQAGLRRAIMLKLFAMYEGSDRNFWCSVKHLGMTMMTLFEAYQANPKDEGLFQLWIRANNSFIRALSHFLGLEITSCASCLHDALQGDKTTEQNKAP